jgi:two-component system chemotaxis response regulator CheB
MIRAIVAEDSPTTRALLVATLTGDPDIQVVGEAEDGARALALAKQLKPDVVVLDVHMPIMTGWEAARRIMNEVPTPIVIVSASTSASELQFTMEALRSGALAALPKPTGPSDPSFERAAERFVATVKDMAGVKVVRRWADTKPTGPARPSGPPPAHTARIAAIAASTGGPAALHRILTALPAGFPAPILLVQHLAPGFTQGLASWLASGCRIRVEVAVSGRPVQPGVAYVAPDGAHLGVHGGQIVLSHGDAIEGFRPSATATFRSVAEAFGPAALGVVLTGMGSDGTPGLRDLAAAGGHVIAQDEATSVVHGMPGSAIAAGVAHEILPVEAIAARMVALTGASR